MTERELQENVDLMCGYCAWRAEDGGCKLSQIRFRGQEVRAGNGSCEDALLYTLEGGSFNVGVGIVSATMFRLARGSWGAQVQPKFM